MYVIAINKAVLIRDKGTLTRLEDFSSPLRLLKLAGRNVAEELLPKRSRRSGSIVLLPVLLLRICVVANAPDHEIWEWIHQPGRFYLETKAFFPDILSNLIPRRRVLYQYVSRCDDTVVDFRVGQVPRVALEFLVGIAVAAVAAPGMFVGRLEGPVVLVPLANESRC